MPRIRVIVRLGGGFNERKVFPPQIVALADTSVYLPWVMSRSERR